jgi:hypothetical protein
MITSPLSALNTFLNIKAPSSLLSTLSLYSLYTPHPRLAAARRHQKTLRRISMARAMPEKPGHQS